MQPSMVQCSIFITVQLVPVAGDWLNIHFVYIVYVLHDLSDMHSDVPRNIQNSGYSTKDKQLEQICCNTCLHCCIIINI